MMSKYHEFFGDHLKRVCRQFIVLETKIRFIVECFIAKEVFPSSVKFPPSNSTITLFERMLLLVAIKYASFPLVINRLISLLSPFTNCDIISYATYLFVLGHLVCVGREVGGC